MPDVRPHAEGQSRGENGLRSLRLRVSNNQEIQGGIKDEKEENKGKSRIR